MGSWTGRKTEVGGQAGGVANINTTRITQRQRSFGDVAHFEMFMEDVLINSVGGIERTQDTSPRPHRQALSEEMCD